jgi:hypothetical protein
MSLPGIERQIELVAACCHAAWFAYTVIGLGDSARSTRAARRSGADYDDGGDLSGGSTTSG